jgi:hypothetical protein
MTFFALDLPLVNSEFGRHKERYNSYLSWIRYSSRNLSHKVIIRLKVLASYVICIHRDSIAF